MRPLALLGIFLLASPVHAAADPGAQRWVNADGVHLRAHPGQDGTPGASLPRGTRIDLAGEAPQNGVCAVRTDTGPGYVACSVLEAFSAPLTEAEVAQASDAIQLTIDQAVGMFRAEPGWNNLSEYARVLARRYPEKLYTTPYPRDEALERMKAQLASGMRGPAPVPLADWAGLKRKAVQYAHMSKETRRLGRQGKTDAAVLDQGTAQARQISVAVGQALGLGDSLHDTEMSDGERRLMGLVDVLEFAQVAPSLFRSEAQIAPPGASVEQASGRFGIVYRQLLAARPVPPPGPRPDDDTEHWGGLYDMKSRTDALVRPVQRVQLQRDGRLHSEASAMRTTELLWDGDAPMCWDWMPGFAFGDADAGAWAYYGEETAEKRKLNRNRPGSLFAFYTTRPLPQGRATLRQAAIRLDRRRTGFIEGTHLYYDLDADGIADLAVWEGQGKADGYLGGTTLTDDRWYRLLLVNINGAWKVLGSDTFSYGCGC